MGCDGGTIPRRDELVKKKQKPEEKDKQAEAAAKWRYCALSCQQLRRPIVSCSLGRLYNKEAIIQYLLDKESTNELVQHIRGLKDVKELNLTEKAGFEEKSVENGNYADTMDSQFICPVTALEMNGKYKFCYLQTCGCVLSERALKEVKTETCHKCNKPFSDDEIITLNGNDEEIEQLKARMEEKRAKEKLEKKGKKRKVVEEESNGKLSSVQSSIANGKLSGAGIKSIKTTETKQTTKPSTSSLLTEKALNKYSIAKDDKASETYKSLFTTHESAKNKPKAHWVTFNPLYN